MFSTLSKMSFGFDYNQGAVVGSGNAKFRCSKKEIKQLPVSNETNNDFSVVLLVQHGRYLGQQTNYPLASHSQPYVQPQAHYERQPEYRQQNEGKLLFWRKSFCNNNY